MAPSQTRMRQPPPNIGPKFPGRQYTLDNADKTPVQLEDLFLVKNLRSVDTTPEGLAKTWMQEKRLEIPRGTYEQIKTMGYLELEEGDAVFSRSLTGDGDPMKDVLQVLVASGHFCTPEMKLRLDEARDRILGPRNQRNRKCPVKKDGKISGGTAYERSGIAKSVKTPARAYTIGPSLESPTSIMAPVASAKAREDGSMDPAVGDRSFLLEAVLPFAMATMQEAPEHVCDNLQARSSLLNKAPIGSPDNWAYATGQLNLAAAKEGAKATHKSARLTNDLGYFGGAHADKKDAKAWYSNMTCNHDIPEDYDPGMFFILQLGVFIRLKCYSSMNFFGHRQHGGTPPLSPNGAPAKWAYRWVVIMYPPQRMVNGTARVTLAALPNNEALIMPPEVLHTEWDVLPFSCHCAKASFIREGLAMIVPASVVTIVVRWLLLFMFYLLQQLPANLKIQMDPDLIIQAITYEQNGERVNIGPWSRHLAINAVRSAAWVAWYTYEDHVVSNIPYLGRKGTVRPGLPKTKKSGKTMQQEEVNQNSGSESDSDFDSDDQEEMARRRGEKQTREEAQRAAEKKAKEERAAIRAAKERANLGKKKKKAKVLDVDNTDSGVSLDEAEAEPAAAAAQPGPRNDRAIRVMASENGVSDKSLGKRKERPLESPTDNIDSNRRTLRSAPGSQEERKTTAGWSHAALASVDVEMEDGATVEPHHSEFLFLECIMLETPQTNLHKIEASCLAVMPPMGGDHAVALEVLQSIFAAIAEAPNAENTPVMISGLWRKLEIMGSQDAALALTSRLLHHRIMATNHRAWQWLDQHCSQEIAEAVIGGRLLNHWIHRLARDVKNVIENRAKAQDFVPSDYGLNLEFPFTFQYRCSAPRYIMDSELATEVTKLTIQFVARWLQFPHNPQSRLQAWFIHLVGMAWGEAALLLDEVWQSYSHLTKYVLGGCKHEATISRLEQLNVELRSHPLGFRPSAEFNILANMEGLLDQMQDANFRYTAIGLGHPRDLDGDPDGGREDGDEEMAPLAHEQRMSPPELEVDESDVDADADVDLPRDPDYLHLAKTHLLQNFYRFLTEAAEAPNATARNAFQARLSEKMDYLYPYREEAPSRQRVLESDGPFAPLRVRTDAGMLSALIFRGVTFGTEFLSQYPTSFDSIDHFHEIKDQASQAYMMEHGTNPPPTYFCLPNAYGPTNHRRVVGLADEYAAALKLDSWAAKFQGHSQIPFWECFEWLSGERPCPVSRKNVRRFKILGPLASYLLTADLVYAGAVVEPSEDEMGKIIWLLNKGDAQIVARYRGRSTPSMPTYVATSPAIF
ncbi:hypothetical protein B0H14DRAFT_2586035 [Mycena olivaceomarginata]|nr:hypothetical protein B0H14DRAFT_2586035 [Mycena olivaceomarginata]